MPLQPQRGSLVFICADCDQRTRIPGLECIPDPPLCDSCHLAAVAAMVTGQAEAKARRLLAYDPVVHTWPDDTAPFRRVIPIGNTGPAAEGARVTPDSPFGGGA